MDAFIDDLARTLPKACSIGRIVNVLPTECKVLEAATESNPARSSPEPGTDIRSPICASGGKQGLHARQWVAVELLRSRGRLTQSLGAGLASRPGSLRLVPVKASTVRSSGKHLLPSEALFLAARAQLVLVLDSESESASASEPLRKAGGTCDALHGGATCAREAAGEGSPRDEFRLRVVSGDAVVRLLAPMADLGAWGDLEAKTRARVGAGTGAGIGAGAGTGAGVGAGTGVRSGERGSGASHGSVTDSHQLWTPPVAPSCDAFARTDTPTLSAGGDTVHGDTVHGFGPGRRQGRGRGRSRSRGRGRARGGRGESRRRVKIDVARVMG